MSIIRRLASIASRGFNLRSSRLAATENFNRGDVIVESHNDAFPEYPIELISIRTSMIDNLKSFWNSFPDDNMIDACLALSVAINTDEVTVTAGGTT
jgi:hypothetical protein